MGAGDGMKQGDWSADTSSNFVNFSSNRASRRRFIGQSLFCLVGWLTLASIRVLAQSFFGENSPVYALAWIGVFVCWLGILIIHVTEVVKRLHDMNKSGWIYFCLFIPLVNILLFFKLFSQRGTLGDNLWGEDPCGDGRLYKRPLLIAIGCSLLAAVAAYYVASSQNEGKPPSLMPLSSQTSARLTTKNVAFTKVEQGSEKFVIGINTVEKIQEVTLSKKEKALFVELAKAPCSAQVAYNLVTSLQQNLHFSATLQLERDYTQKCGAFLELRWAGFAAAKSLGRIDLAIAKVSSLIADYPDDKDYWVWRGYAFEKIGEFSKAAADFEQAIRIEPKLQRVPLNLVQIYEQLNVPCRALNTLKNYVIIYPALISNESIFDRLDHLASMCNPHVTI